MMIQILFIYSDKIEYGVDGNGRNMVYSSRVAVKHKHHKVNVYVMFLCPRNTLSCGGGGGSASGAYVDGPILF